MTWYALRVTGPCFDRWREFEIRDWLQQHGCRALVPVEFRIRKPNRGPVRRPRLSGYVFAENPPFESLRRVPGYLGPVGVGPSPLTLTQFQVDALEDLSIPLQTPKAQSAFRVGDRIRRRKGHLATVEALVTQLEGSRIVYEYEMMGKTHTASADSTEVEAA
jgi:transcription antitermination factor NusG